MPDTVDHIHSDTALARAAAADVTNWDHTACSIMAAALYGVIERAGDPQAALARALACADAAADLTAAATAALLKRRPDGLVPEQNAPGTSPADASGLADGAVRDTDIAILLAQIDAAREMDGQLSDDPDDITLIEQIRDGWKARSAEAAR